MERKNWAEKKVISRPLLKYERERRGWTLEYVATLIDCPDPHTIARWERGVIFPSPRYRQSLCELFEKNAEELGLLKQEMPTEERSHYQLIPELDMKGAIPCSHSYFFFNEKLPATDEFYGREIEREMVLNRTYRRSSTSIVGPQRIGKTWLLEYLLLEVKTRPGSRFRVGYLDATMASCATVAGFTAKAAKELGLPLAPERANSGPAALEEAIEMLKAKGHHTVLCIDEFESFGTRPEFDVNFFAHLRALTQVGLCLVIASQRPLIDIVGNDRNTTSDFFNIFEQLTLEPFEREEAEEFIAAKSMLAGFDEQEREVWLKYGEVENGLWLPIRLQLVGKMLLEDKNQRAKRKGHRYRPEEAAYWQRFAQRLEEKYRGAVR